MGSLKHSFWGVTADSNFISFGRLCRSAIDHRHYSINTGQCAIGTGVSLGSAGTALCFPDLNAVDDCDSLYLDEDTWAREVADRD